MELLDYLPMIWCNLYRKSFLDAHELRMNNTLHEDEDFMPRVLLVADRVSLIESFDYSYRRSRTGSLITTRNNSSIQSMADILERFITIYRGFKNALM